MNVTVHFYDSSTDLVLAVPRINGGVNNIIFESVSECWSHAREIGAKITSIVTHKTNREEVVTC